MEFAHNVALTTEITICKLLPDRKEPGTSTHLWLPWPFSVALTNSAEFSYIKVQDVLTNSTVKSKSKHELIVSSDLILGVIFAFFIIVLS